MAVLGLDLRRWMEAEAALDEKRPAPLYTNPVLAPSQPDAVVQPMSLAGLSVGAQAGLQARGPVYGPPTELAAPYSPPEQQGGLFGGLDLSGGAIPGFVGGVADAVGSGLNAVGDFASKLYPYEEPGSLGMPAPDYFKEFPGADTLRNAAGDVGGLVGRAYDNYLEAAGRVVPDELGGTTPGGLSSAESGLRSVGEASVPTTYAEVAAAPLIGLFPGVDDALKAGGRRAAGAAAGYATRAGSPEVGEAIRGVAGLVDDFEVPPALLTGEGTPRTISPTLGEGVPAVGGGAATMPDDMAAWEYSLKKLQEAKQQGPDAFKAEQARQAEIVRKREIVAREVEKGNAKQQFSPAEKQRRKELAVQAAEARLKARETYGAAIDELPDDIPNIAGSAPNAPPLTLRQTRELAHFTDMTKGVIENNSIMQRVYDSARPITGAVSGDIPDSKLAEMIAREGELRDVLTRSDAAHGKPFTNDEINEVAKVWREAFLGRYYKGADLDIAKRTLEERSKAAFASELGAVDSVSDLWKSTTLNGDFSILGQQVEAAFRRGSVPTITGILRDAVNRGAAKMNMPGALEVYLRNDIDHVSQAMADGLQMSGGKTADINLKGSLFGKIPGVGKPVEAALDKLADIQYGAVLGTVRLRAYEGLLTQNMLLHKLSGGLLGGDIKDPLVRRHIAEMANVIGSTGRTATGAQRAKWERRGLLSPRMTRAQINEVLTPLKSFRSQEDVINTLNLIGSVALTMYAGKVLNDQFGIGEFVTDPLAQGFGQIVTSAKDKDGKNHVIDIFPQFAFPKAIIRSIGALEEGDLKKLQEAWQRYGFGRLNMIPGLAGRVAGYGYDEKGKFHAVGGEKMNLEQAFRGDDAVAIAGNNIAPLTGKQIYEDAKDPVNVGTALIGQGAFEESVYGAEDRFARQSYGQKYEDLNPLDKAKVHVEMASDGLPIDDWSRADPYFKADDEAFRRLKKQSEALAAYDSLTAFRDEITRRARAKGANKQTANEIRQNIEAQLGLTEITSVIRKVVVAADPDIIKAIQALYEAGELDSPPSKELAEVANQSMGAPVGSTR